MIDRKDLFINNYIVSGDFYYELAILVGPNGVNDAIIDYTKYIWSLTNIEGPFDKRFNKVSIDHNSVLTGLLNFDRVSIPIKTMNIIESFTGDSWFDLCFYSSTVENALGLKPGVLNDKLIHPEILSTFFEKILKDLNRIFPFEIAMAGIEMGGMYDIDTFKNKFENDPYGLFYIGKKNYNEIAEENKKYLKIID